MLYVPRFRIVDDGQAPRPKLADELGCLALAITKSEWMCMLFGRVGRVSKKIVCTNGVSASERIHMRTMRLLPTQRIHHRYLFCSGRHIFVLIDASV